MTMNEISILYHLIAVLGLLWFIASSFPTHNPLLYLLSFLYLYLVNDRYTKRLRRKIQFEERNNANQSRLLSDSESVRWLNHAIAKVWPICMEQIASQQFLLPVIPWFLDKYKPWTAKKAVVQHLYLGRNPPVFNKIRVLAESADDDHLVLEMGLSFLAGDDMSATLGVKLRRSLGFGMWAKMHMTGMHVEGKILVGVKFLQHWPFLGRVRMSFVEPPYFQVTVKPIFSHGMDVTEVPGISGWLDRLLSIAFQETLVEPNMLVVDVEKFVSSPTENWFTVDEKPPTAFAKVEIIEGADMKPSDLNGLADPYVRGRLGNFIFRTKIQWKTLNPKWHETFKIPITNWEKPNILVLEVRDKDRIFDDTMGNTNVDINDPSLRDGQRHDKWLVLDNIKMGRLHLAVTVMEADRMKDFIEQEDMEQDCEQDQMPTSEPVEDEKLDVTTEGPVELQSPKNADKFEPINVEGQEKTGIWVHHPRNDVPLTWEPRKGSRVRDVDIHLEADEVSSSRQTEQSDSSSCEDNQEQKRKEKSGRLSKLMKGLKRLGSALHSSPKGKSPSNGSSPVTPSHRTPSHRSIASDKMDVIDEGGGNYKDELKADSERGGDQAKMSVARGIRSVRSAISKRNSTKGKGDGDFRDVANNAPANEILFRSSSIDDNAVGEKSHSRTPSSARVNGLAISPVSSTMDEKSWHTNTKETIQETTSTSNTVQEAEATEETKN